MRNCINNNKCKKPNWMLRLLLRSVNGTPTPPCYNGGSKGLYTKEEIDDMVADGYIPIANKEEFNEIKSITGLPQTMGLGSCWEGDYITGLNEKYIVVSDIDFTGYSASTANVTNVIDCNELGFNGLDITFPLFDCSGATIKNVRINGANMDSTSGSVGSRGILIGTITSGTLDNNIVEGVVLNDGVTSIMCGGNTTTLSGAVTITNCHTLGSCESVGSGTNNSGVGGVVGQLIGSSVIPVSIINCSNNGVITGGRDYVGGISGRLQFATVTDCYNLGAITATGEYAGGLVGILFEACTVENCYSIANITGDLSGGFSGWIRLATTVSNCYCVGAVTGSSNSGFIDRNDTSSATDSYWDTTIGPATSTAGIGQTTSALQTPTSATGIYANWSEISWDFRTSSLYPVTKGVSSEIPPGGDIEDGILVLELGQSNMEGRDQSMPPNTTPLGNGYWWNGFAAVQLTDDRGDAVGGSHATYFANRLNAISTAKPILIEAASGASGLTSTSAGGAVGNDWSATGTLRAAAETQVTDAIAGIGNITGITCALWCQGENDALEIDTSGGSYTKAMAKTAMQDVIDWFQAAYPSIPFLISQTGRENSGDTTGYSEIRAMQTEIVNENTDVYMAFTGAVGFPAAGKMSDNVHYNYEGYDDMGVAFADELNTFI